jgi:hypothetical protein
MTHHTTHAGDGNLALQLWEQMKAQGLMGDSATVLKLVDTLVKARNPRKALTIYEEVSARTPEMRDNVGVSNAVLHALSASDPLR